jgi:hypothetical protein
MIKTEKNTKKSPFIMDGHFKNAFVYNNIVVLKVFFYFPHYADKERKRKKNFSIKNCNLIHREVSFNNFYSMNLMCVVTVQHNDYHIDANGVFFFECVCSLLHFHYIFFSLSPSAAQINKILTTSRWPRPIWLMESDFHTTNLSPLSHT